MPGAIQHFPLKHFTDQCGSHTSRVNWAGGQHTAFLGLQNNFPDLVQVKNKLCLNVPHIKASGTAEMDADTLIQ